MTAQHRDEPGEERGAYVPGASDALGSGQQRLLRRSRTDRVVAGVCGGLGHYLGIDPILLRLAFVALVFAGGAGILLYFVSWIVIPEADADEPLRAAPSANADTARLIVGGVLVALGAIILFERILPWFDSTVVWALVLIAIGAAVIFRGMQR
ncbi:PspC domain-containing protein [Sphaerobacter sp.]|uniref:PspC domain-containing protein n=1 Tax=Sphaerobacter sp. TaxID=2099654 RepID=UPI001D237CBD|nr:PspC domain-containing protein [Sphaerobacter sp.]MBX5443779.1 PspC domain-containing protein [Sphaerobacter sp.]